MFNPSREQVRQFFCDAWKKHQERRPLVGAEVTAADIAARHPEYHALLADSAGAVDREWTPEGGQTNPFLHLSLHLAIHEQVSIDQPRASVPPTRRYGRAWTRTMLNTSSSNVWARQSGAPSVRAARWMPTPIWKPSGGGSAGLDVGGS